MSVGCLWVLIGRLAGHKFDDFGGDLGLTHLSFAVDNLDETVQLVIDHGGSLIEGTRAAPGAVPQVVFVADPDGTRCELLER